jgi:hypothetical protein
LRAVDRTSDDEETQMADNPSPEELARWHRWFAIECNNRAWQLADQPTRTDAESDALLNAAHAAALHWSHAGNELNDARARMLLAHAHAACGNGQLALRYAHASHAYIMSIDSPDWEIAFSHAVMAHAAATAGAVDLHAAHYRAARTAADAIVDPEDKAVFEKSFAAIPSP